MFQINPSAIGRQKEKSRKLTVPRRNFLEEGGDPETADHPN